MGKILHRPPQVITVLLLNTYHCVPATVVSAVCMWIHLEGSNNPHCPGFADGQFVHREVDSVA